MNKLIVTRWNSRVLTALVSEKTTIELGLADTASILGNIYIGKVKNIAENIRAAFIEIENGTVCYYSLEEKAEPFFVNQKKNNRVCIGDELLVQVCREPIRGKLPCVTCDLNLAGRYVVLTSKFEPLGFSGKLKAQRKQELRELLQAHLPEDAGVILRTNSAHAEGGEILEELDKLYGQLKEIQKKSGMRTCFSKLLRSGNGFASAWRPITPISAISNQLPCFGV